MAEAGLHGRKLLETLVRACESGLVPSTGYVRGTIKGEWFSSMERHPVRQTWRVFQRGLTDPFGRVELLEQDWDRGSFRYTFHHDDSRPPAVVTCFIDWLSSSAVFNFGMQADEERGTEITHSSILLDGHSLRALLADKNGKQPRPRRKRFDWPSFEKELMRYLEANGPFQEYGDLAKAEKAMAVFCDISWTKTPSEAAIRKKVTEVEADYRKANLAK